MKAAALAALLVLAALPAQAADCPLDLGHGTGLVVYSQQFILAVRPEPATIEVGQAVVLHLNVCTKSGEPAELTRVDAQLDEANVIAEAHIVPGIEGRYRVEGLVFTAAGAWEIGFEVAGGGKAERLTHDLIAK
ncbi:MAG: hypothetical protein JSR24_20035 [Proteobacteria bacterium]|nr:hypothetical protein [Pseudomonadota bacterium]